MSNVLADRKRLIGIILLLIILAAIPLSVYLIRRQQTLKSKAFTGSGGEFLDSNGSPLPRDGNGVQIAPNPQVQLKVQYQP